MLSQFLGYRPGEGGGGNGGTLTIGDLLGGESTTFGEIQAYRDIMAYLADGESSLSGWMQNYLNSSQNCCPNGALTLGEFVAEGTASFSRGGLIGLGWMAINDLFGSAHIPANPKTMGIAYGNVMTVAELKAAATSTAVRSRGNQTGSYTITFEGNYKYHGKGPLSRMMVSAIQQSVNHKSTVQSMHWLPSVSDREAFKAEYRRMQTDATVLFPQGYQNPINFNIRQSPGYLYILQDGY